MKKLLMMTVCAALAACGANEDEMPTESLPEDDTATMTQPADPALAEAAGTYEITTDDGTVTMQTVNADGTYVDTVGGTQAARGTVRMDGESMCYDPEGPDPEVCYNSGEPAEDGSFRATTGESSDSGVTIRKVG